MVKKNGHESKFKKKSKGNFKNGSCLTITNKRLMIKLNPLTKNEDLEQTNQRRNILLKDKCSATVVKILETC